MCWSNENITLDSVWNTENEIVCQLPNTYAYLKRENAETNSYFMFETFVKFTLLQMRWRYVRKSLIYLKPHAWLSLHLWKGYRVVSRDWRSVESQICSRMVTTDCVFVKLSILYRYRKWIFKIIKEILSKFVLALYKTNLERNQFTIIVFIILIFGKLRILCLLFTAYCII